MLDKQTWTEEDVLELIKHKVKENVNLDYKACKSLLVNGKPKDIEKSKFDLSKDVSAFANSDGGILVYGVKEEGNVPLEIDDGYDPLEVTREWIEQVINSRIQRRIDGIRVHQVDLKNTRPGRVLYVVSIPQSFNAPHMASDKRYYKRFNFSSEPMEDYEVRDVRRRQEVPNLHLLMQPKVHHENPKLLKLFLSITNNSAELAKYYGLRVYFDKKLIVKKPREYIDGKEITLKSGESELTLNCIIRTFSPLDSIPIWEGEIFDIGEVSFESLVSDKLRGNYVLGWEISSPGFKKSELYILTATDETTRLTHYPFFE